LNAFKSIFVRFEQYLRDFLAWRMRHVKDKDFILFLSAVIGLVTGLVAVTIKNFVYIIKSLLTKGFENYYFNFLYFLYPVAGILIVVLIIKYIIRHPIGHGIPGIFLAISKKNAIIKKHNMFSSIITSVLTVGFGGSVGLEGPSVVTGAAIGSNLGKTMHMDFRSRTLLIGCAASGAMAAIFEAPIGAMLFSIEVIMIDLTISSLVPLLLASSIAVLTSHFFLGKDILFHFNLQDEFLFSDIPFFLFLAIICGLISVYFTKVFIKVQSLFDKISNSYYKILIGGLLLGTIIFFLPPLYGEGYESINALLSGSFDELMQRSIFSGFTHNAFVIMIFFLLLILSKVFATSLTLSAGGVGGLFAPSLFLGSVTGFFFAATLNYLNLAHLSLSNFTLVAMCGTLSGILHAPLTAIFLIAEVTGGYELFLPLMLTAAISYVTVRYFTPYSIYTYQSSIRGEILTHHKDKTVLTLLKVENLVETNFITVHPDQNLRHLVKVIKDSVRNIFPVVDEEGNYLGLIPLDNVRSIMFDQESYDTVKMRELMIQAKESVSLDDTMDNVMEKFKSTGYWNLPVIHKGKYLGFVSRANIFNAYRKMLIEFSED